MLKDHREFLIKFSIIKLNETNYFDIRPGYIIDKHVDAFHHSSKAGRLYGLALI